MQQCVRRATRSTTCAAAAIPRPQWLQTSACLIKRPLRRRYAAVPEQSSGTYHEQAQERLQQVSLVPQLKSGAKLSYPSRREQQNISAWIDRLETALPIKLRTGPFSGSNSPEISPAAAFALISDARRLKGHDILLEYSRQGRWKALVWLVTALVDDLWRGNPSANWKLPHTPIGRTASLDNLLDAPISLPPIQDDNYAARPLDKVVLADHPLSRGAMRQTTQGYQALGEIWQSLGAMVLEDGARNQGQIKPEILELIALLHSRGIMPDSIYSYSPERSRLAGTQPPTLRLLSSQIMTSLSDAAWNARQASAMEAARVGGALVHHEGPELPSSDYRVRVAGIRHEIWLELVLWSCLHGGWIRQGAAIVEMMIRQTDQPWSPLSWRETMSPLIRVGDESNIDWERTEYLFTHGRVRSASRIGEQIPQIERTISSEVISAYVEATVSLLSVGVGERGVPLGSVINLLIAIKRFLSQNNFGLEASSWDAVVQRILESESIDVEEAPNFAELLLSLSASYGEDEGVYHVPTRDEAWRPTSPYMSDGSALTLSLAHRALSAYVQRGEFAGAFRTFRELQQRTDHNKRLSIAAFFRNLRSSKHEIDSTSLDFRSPVASIAFPGMFPMLPANVLAPFLDMVSEIKAFQFGSWLVASQDVDGPTIGPTAYQNPLMVPSLIRFLAASGNEELLGKMLRTIRHDPRHKDLPANVLLAILEGQLALNNSRAAAATFDTMIRTCTLTTSTTEVMVALLCREVVKSSNPDSLLTGKLIATLRGEHGIERRVRRNIAAIMMHVSEEMKNLCREAIQLPESIIVYPETKTFNLILDGHIKRYGSLAGRSLICTFSHTAQDQIYQHERTELLDTDGTDVAEADRAEATGIPITRGNVRPGSTYTPPTDMLDLTIEDARRAAKDSNKWAPVQVYGRFSPNVSSVRSILAQRLKEIQAMEESEMSQAVETDETVQWAKRLLGVMGMRPGDVDLEALGQYDEDTHET
ncbi:hypothetical protein ANO11243_085690 [Dothideomycetidae sp. 11243]|nr:hypothetical protein ANO11243_085690 [fungal sp. No.11243]